MIQAEDWPIVIILVLYIGFVCLIRKGYLLGRSERFTQRDQLQGGGFLKDEATAQYEQIGREISQLKYDLMDAKSKRSFVVQQKIKVDIVITNAQRKYNKHDPDQVKSELQEQKDLAAQLRTADDKIAQIEKKIKECESVQNDLKKQAGFVSWAIHSIGF